MAASLLALRQKLKNSLLKVVFSQSQEKCVFFSSIVAKELNTAKEAVGSAKDADVQESVEYPPIKPKYPPGKWGDMEPSYAWLWQKTKDELMLIQDVKGRQDVITNPSISHINALNYNDHPSYFDFAKFATKSVLFPWVNSSSETKPEEEKVLKKIKTIIEDHILIENEAVERLKIHTYETLSSLRKKQAEFVKRCIFDTLISNLNGQANHLRTCQYDEDVVVRAVWERYGFERKRRHRISPSRFTIDTVLDYRLTCSCVFNAMLRSDLPLPQFQPRQSGLSIESEKPVLKFKSSAYGTTKIPAFSMKSIMAGHVLGDPCEYGLIGFLLNHNHKELDEKFGPKIAKECRLGRGLVSTFTWLAAQAYNQGFSGYIDMTYPLTSQTVMSDGRTFSFLAYQLNTMELYKPDSANDMVNLCWHSDEMALYDCIENGQVKGFNDDVLRILIRMFLLEPVCRGYDMKPTISSKEDALGQKSGFIPAKPEEEDGEEEEVYIV